MSKIATCIGCGCDDDHACVVGGGVQQRDSRGCHWVRADYESGSGVCSECPEHVEFWDRRQQTRGAAP